MAILEFDVIKRYFSNITDPVNAKNISLSIGDDAAVISCQADKDLVVCTDTLNAGVHFPEDTSAADIAYKALTVNLSDIAAMGAEPEWFTLNISCPDINEQWIKAFSESLAELAKQYKLALVGGDTTRGPLSVTITLAGYTTKSSALTRSNAQVGDSVYLSGCSGEAAYGLHCIKNNLKVSAQNKYFIERLNRPTARIELGLSLRNIAHACIDISDGLLADIAHIAEASDVGIELERDKIPLPKIENKQQALQYALTGGDDYELVFTVAEKHCVTLSQLAKQHHLALTCIGSVVDAKGLRLLDENKQPVEITQYGYEHFK